MRYLTKQTKITMKKILAPIILLVLFSCEETEQLTNAENTTEAVEALTEYTTINKVFQDIGNNSGDAVLVSENAATSKSILAKNDAPAITVEPLDFTTFPKTITIDYGTGIVCKDGVTRKGIATIVSTDWYRNVNSEHTTTFTNYYHNNFKVEGTHKTKNLGANTNGNLQYEVTINNGKIIKDSGAEINYTENSTRTWVAGSDTPLYIWDDEYLLEGTQSGISSKNVGYSLTVEEPLHFTLLPRQVKSGILNVQVGAINDIKINYTTSMITVFGKSYPFGD